jgi:hypothetical protein
MAAINVLGGVAVLGSYAWGLGTHPEATGALWGGVPASLRVFYTPSMFLAAAGYFCFSWLLFVRTDPARARVGGRLGFGVFNVLYLLILVPSALWLPLTFEMIESPSAGLWWAIRLVLFAVAAGSLGLLAALLALRPRQPGASYWLGVAGAVAFANQTALLDALVWPVYFPL